METGDSPLSWGQESGCGTREQGETPHPMDATAERSAAELPSSNGNPSDMDIGQGEVAAGPRVGTMLPSGGDLADGVPCRECGASFLSLQAYMEHRCPNARCPPLQHTNESEDNELQVSDLEDSDVESLAGEIIYQPNGSAFIFKSKESEGNTQPGALSIFPPLGYPSLTPLFPHIIRNFHIASSLGEQSAADETFPNTSALAGIGPVLHSFRVYDLRHDDDFTADGTSKSFCMSKDVPKAMDLSIFDGCVRDGKRKPVLMCFLCKLSFGYVRSFVNHAVHDHQMVLNQEEQKVLANKYVSAIIQGIGQDKEPLVSFLEPKKPLSLLPLFSAAHPAGPDPGLHAVWSSQNAEKEASLHPGFAFLKGNVSLETSAEGSGRKSKMPKTEANPGGPSPSVKPSSLDCSSSRLEGGVQDSCSARRTDGYAVKREPEEPEDVGDDGGARCSVPEDSEGDGKVGVDLTARKDSPLSNQSISPLSSPVPKYDIKGTSSSSATVPDDVVMNKLATSPLYSSDADCHGGSKEDWTKSQANGTPSAPGNLRMGDDMSQDLTHQHVTIHGAPSTGQDSPGSNTECPKCDGDLGLARSPSGKATTVESKNSSKTLKCPKCNWHYKYQQSLDIHVKEKHPGLGGSCPHCGTGQPQPGLVRDESHTCGHKLFRCEVCNYSTVTKGNLSIHMQSEKHITNVQALQNGAMDLDDRQNRSAPAPSPRPSDADRRVHSPAKAKQRPTWRCEVCGYETGVARNLRIHMTSEKHMHSMLLLQQGLKQIGGGLRLGLMPTGAQLYHSYLAQNLVSTGLATGSLPDSLVATSPIHNGLFTATVNEELLPLGGAESVLSAEELLPNSSNSPQRLYHCGVCDRFASDSLDVLSAHVSKERTLPLEDWRTVAGELQQCRLCGYSTQLRANFLLHCQTECHLQQYQLAAHLKEAGEPNWWRLKGVAAGSPRHLKCIACNYHSNSIEKLRLHATSQRHEAAVRLCKYLQKKENALSSDSCYFYCSLCDYSTKTKLHLVQHLRSVRHQQAEGLRKLQLCQKGLGSDVDSLADLLFVKNGLPKEPVAEKPGEKSKDPAKAAASDQDQNKEDGKRRKKIKTEPEMNTLGNDSEGILAEGKRALLSENTNDVAHKRLKASEGEATSNKQVHQCPYCSYRTKDQSHIEKHVLSHHSVRPTLSCPLCQDVLSSKIHLQLHLTHLHSVAADCVEKLLADVPGPDVMIPKNKVLPAVAQDKCGKPQDNCSNDEKNSTVQDKGEEGLQNVLEVKTPRAGERKRTSDQEDPESQREPMGELQKKQEHLVSHGLSYKDKDDRCSLAFRTAEEPQTQPHGQFGSAISASSTSVCALCLHSFHTDIALRKHLESSHLELSEAELQQLCRSPALLDDFCPETDARESKLKLDKDSGQEGKQNLRGNDSGPLLDKMGSEHKRNGPLVKSPNFCIEKFLDPSRPYKCTVCKESFTQKNILLVHYNSVSHLHKLKKVLNNTSAPVLQEANNSVHNKPYKCHICNVAYSQSSTLEIHMRSVLHQTKARTAKVDTSNNVSNGNFGAALLPQSPGTVGQGTVDSASLLAAPKKDDHTDAKEVNRKNSADHMFVQPAQQIPLQLQQDLQQQAAVFQPQFLNPAFWPPVLMSPKVLQFQQPQLLFPFYVPGAKVNFTPELTSHAAVFGLPGMPGSLLEDLRQNQLQLLKQQAQQMPASHSEPNLKNEQEQTPKPEEKQSDTAPSVIQTSEHTGDQSERQESKALQDHLRDSGSTMNHSDTEKLKLVESPFLPPRVVLGARGNAARALLENFGFELVMQYNENRQSNQRKNKTGEESATANKLECGVCGKFFSNILILKNHKEHVHRQLFPNVELEKFAQQYREAYDKLYPINMTSPETPLSPPPTPPPPPPLPQTPSQLASTPKKAQHPAPLQSPQPPPTPPTPPPPPLPPQLPQPASLDLPCFLSLMGHLSLPQHVAPQPPSVGSSPSPDDIQLCHQKGGADPDLPQQLESKWPSTQITNDQLKIFQAHFNISAPPNDEQVKDIAEKLGLDQKIVKHWFHGILVKEKQPLKESPNNLISAPVTTVEELRLESQVNGLEFPKRCTAMNKRPIKTRFTDYQIRVLQDFFDISAYPRDDEVDQLSSVLDLPSRVIIIWFQNARQKARKRYENHADSAEDDERKEKANKRFIRTTSMQYLCVKCSVVFLRIFDLITHQKECYQEEDCKEQDDCQIEECIDASDHKLGKVSGHTDSSKHPFGRITSSQSSSPSLPSPQTSVGKAAPKPNLSIDKQQQSEGSLSQIVKALPDTQLIQTPVPQFLGQKSPQNLMTRPQSEAVTSSTLSLAISSLMNSLPPKMLQYQCDQCKIAFPTIELWQEHQQVHLLTTQKQYLHSQFLERSLDMPYVIFDPCSSLTAGKLAPTNLTQTLEQKTSARSAQSDSGPIFLKRKLDNLEENGSSDKECGSSMEDLQRDKRPRTTITPEQLEVLYSKYLLDSNPTRKMLDHIADQVGLKKRVVQVWFQNTRARERKGQFRVLGTSQSHKKCPFCRALFKATSALESHIRSKHWQEAKHMGYILPPSPTVSVNDGVENQQKYFDFEYPPLTTKMESSEYEMSEYEVSAATSNPFKNSEAQEHLVSPSSIKAEDNEGSEGLSANASDACHDQIKTDFNETCSVTTTTSDASTGYSEPNEGKMNILQNTDPFRERFPFNHSNLPLSFPGREKGDHDLHDSADQSETLSLVDPSSPSPFAGRNLLEFGRLSGDRPGHRRSRTQMSNHQVRVLKACFSDCRMPTMQECETLGDKIGLAKRVVQVWFQNARAKEKKFKIHVGKPFIVSQSSPEGSRLQCTLCGTRFAATFPVREHVFSKLHVDKLQETLRNQSEREKDHLTPTTVRQLMVQKELEHLKKRTVDSLSIKSQQETMTEASALLGLRWPPGFPGIPGVNGPSSLPGFPRNTTGSPGATKHGYPFPVTTSPAASLSPTPTKTPPQPSLPVPPPLVPSNPFVSHHPEKQTQDPEKQRKSEEPKGKGKLRDTGNSHTSFKKGRKSSSDEGRNGAAKERGRSRALPNTVAGDPGALLKGQFLPYFFPGLVPCLPPQFTGFVQGASLPPLCRMENLFPYGSPLPQAIAGISADALLQQSQQYQWSLQDALQWQKSPEGQRQKAVPTKQSNVVSGTHQPKEEDVGSSTKSTEQESQRNTSSTVSPDGVPSGRHKFACGKCRMTFADEESAVCHQQSSCCLGQPFSDLQEAMLRKVAGSKYSGLASNVAMSKSKALGQLIGSSPPEEKAVNQAMRDTKEHTRLLPHSAHSSNPNTTSTSQPANVSHLHISCSSMES